MIPGIDLVDLVTDLVFQLLNIFFGSAEAAIQRSVGTLVETEYLDPVTSQFWRSPYATTWGIALGLSVPIGLLRGYRAQKSNDPMQTLRRTAFPGEVILVGLLAPLTYFIGVAMSFGLTETALSFADDTDSFSDIGETNTIPEAAVRIVITVFAWTISWVLRIEVIIIQYLGFVGLMLVPLAIVARGTGDFGNWFFDKVMSLASMAIFGRPLMVTVMVLGAYVMNFIPEDNLTGSGEGLQAFVVLLSLAVAAASPLLVLNIKKRVIARLDQGDFAGGGGSGAKSGGFLGSGSPTGEGIKAAYNTYGESKLDSQRATRPEGFQPSRQSEKWQSASTGAGVAAGVATGGTATAAWMAASAAASQKAKRVEDKERSAYQKSQQPPSKGG